MSPLTLDETCGRKRKLDDMRGPLEAAKAVWTKVRDQSVQKLCRPTLEQRRGFKEREILLIQLTYIRAESAVRAIDENNAYIGSEFPTILQSPPVPSPKKQHVSLDENAHLLDYRWDCSPPTPAPSAREVTRADGGLPVSPLIESSISCSSMADLGSSLAMDGLSSDLHLPFNTPCTPVTGPYSLPEADPSMSYTSLGSSSEAQLDLGSSTLSSIPSSPSSSSSSFSASSSPCDASASPISVPFVSSSQDDSSELLSKLEGMTLEELSDLLEELGNSGENSCSLGYARIPDQPVSHADTVNSELPVLPVDDICSLLDSVPHLPNTSVDCSLVPTGSGFDDMDWADFCY